jgi:hypothetical protein
VIDRSEESTGSRSILDSVSRIASVGLVVGMLALAGVLAWVLVRPTFWIDGLQEGRAAHLQTQVLERQVVALQRNVRALRAAAPREHAQEIYARAVWLFCEGFRGTRSYDSRNYTVQVLQVLAQACDRSGVPTAANSYPAP